MKCTARILVMVILACGLAAAEGDAGNMADSLLALAGCTHGVGVVLAGEEQDLVLDLAAHEGMFVHVLSPRLETCDVLRGMGQSKKLTLQRFLVERWALPSLPHADNVVDFILAMNGAEKDIPVKALLRALRPGGKVIVGATVPECAAGVEAWAKAAGAVLQKPEGLPGTWAVLTKLKPAGMDNWSHWEHGPDNNPVSQDQIIKAPYMTQWLAEPFYIAMPAITVAAGGRTFIAMGHIAHHEREEVWLNTVMARNGYNGMELWRRRLPDGYLVHRSAFVATDDTFYMIDSDGQGCLLLDPETGEERTRINIPEAAGEWKWIALSDNLLYVLSGSERDPAQTTVVRSNSPAWSWMELSTGYYQETVPWGFGEILAAYDLKTKQTRWVHHEASRMDSRAMAVGDGKVFLYAPETRLACLDAKTGAECWSNPDPEVRQRIEEPGAGLGSTPGFKTSCFCVYTPKGLFFAGQTKMNLVAVNKDTGNYLWHQRKTTSNPNVVSLDEVIFAGIGEEGNTLKIDPLTGTILQDLGFRKRSCARLTATPDSLFCRGYDEGVTRYDRGTGVVTFDGSMRPACNDGMMGANGLLYSGPWLCDCNLSIIGAVAQCPANGFEPETLQGDLLEYSGARLQPTSLISGNDWYAHRGGNEHSGSSKVNTGRPLFFLWTTPPSFTEKRQITTPTAAWGQLFVADDNGQVRAFDAATGQLQWSVDTAGPIEQPPALWRSRVFVGSGDGCVYALDAANGALVWKFRAAPMERRTMIYSRLCSLWPVNSGVVVYKGVAYFAAGIIDYDGTYVYGVDAETGELKWVNNSTGHLDKTLRKGVSAQGNLTLAENALWLGAGNVMPPAPYNLEDGVYLGSVPVGDGAPRSNRGEELGVFGGNYLLAGGRLRYSAADNVVNPGVFTFSRGELDSMQAARGSVVPAWDDEWFVCVPSREEPPQAYRSAAILERLESGRHTLPERAWKAGALKDYITHALALSADSVIAVCEKPVARSLFPRYLVCVLDRQEGHLLAEYDLPGMPRMNGLAIDRDGRVIVVMNDGGMTCMGGQAALQKTLHGLGALSKEGKLAKAEMTSRLKAALSALRSEEDRKYFLDSLNEQGVDIVQEILSNGCVVHWNLLGPVPWDNDANPAGKQFAGEPGVNLERPVKVNGTELFWQPYTVTDYRGMVDLNGTFGEMENVAAYACADVELPQAGEILLKIGSNDGFICWFNGQKAGSFDEGRTYVPDQSTLRVTCNQGMNRIVMKVTQMGGGWALSVRITDPQNNPIAVKQK